MRIISITVVQKWQQGEDLKLLRGNLASSQYVIVCVRMGQGKNKNKFLASGLRSRWLQLANRSPCVRDIPLYLSSFRVCLRFVFVTNVVESELGNISEVGGAGRRLGPSLISVFFSWAECSENMHKNWLRLVVMYNGLLCTADLTV
jgi:hypothetical protein